MRSPSIPTEAMLATVSHDRQKVILARLLIDRVRRIQPDIIRDFVEHTLLLDNRTGEELQADELMEDFDAQYPHAAGCSAVRLAP